MKTKNVTMDGIKYRITGFTKVSKMAIGEWKSKYGWKTLINENTRSKLYKKYH